MLWLYEPVFPKYAYLVLIIVIGYVKVQQWFCHNWLIDQWPKKSCFSSCSLVVACVLQFHPVINDFFLFNFRSSNTKAAITWGTWRCKGFFWRTKSFAGELFPSFDAKNASVSQVFFNVPELSQSKAARVAFKGWVGTYSYFWFNKKSWDKFCCSVELFEPPQFLHLASA